MTPIWQNWSYRMTFGWDVMKMFILAPPLEVLSSLSRQDFTKNFVNLAENQRAYSFQIISFWRNYQKCLKFQKITQNFTHLHTLIFGQYSNGCSGILRLNNRTIFLKIHPITSYHHGRDLFSFIQETQEQHWIEVSCFYLTMTLNWVLTYSLSLFQFQNSPPLVY